MQVGQTIEGYLFEKRLGKGGMAEVWSAKSAAASESVAIKILLPQLLDNRNIRVRFEREGQINLDHPNIVPVLRLVTIEGRPGIVMRLFSGGSLEARLRPTEEEQQASAG